MWTRLVTDRTEGIPGVAVNEASITMQQATTGKWYAYIADDSIGATNLVGAANGETDYPPETGFLTGSSVPSPVVQVFDLDDGDSVDITAGRDESVTLTYDDHSGAATVSVDRNDAPIGGQVHVTISDLQLNLDPTDNDAWELNATDNTATYANVAVDVDADNVAPGLPGTSGELTVSVSREDVIEYSGVADIVTIDETGSNTGVFESQDGDISEISVSKGASDGDTFTVGYADDSQQVIVNDFSSTLELIADGAWDSGESLTIRLSSEDLNLNTLDDDDMTEASDDLPVLILGDPITLGTVKMAIVEKQTGESISVNDAHVATLSATQLNTTITVTLTPGQNDRLKDETMSHYAHLSSGFTVVTTAQLEGSTGNTTISNGLTAINVTDDADGIFNVTFAAD